MSIIDWSILSGFLTFLLLMAIFTQRYLKSVAGFLSAERCAGRYLLSVANDMSAIGAITIIAQFESIYKAGFAPKWWEILFIPTVLIVTLTGWQYYRYRQTRALTLAQFLEKRYCRSFRIYAGLIGWFSGVLNFGIFPSVGARFIIYFCGLPQNFGLMGYEISTFVFLVALLLTIALFFTLIGGQITVMVTDFLQGTFLNISIVLIVGYLLLTLSWSHFSDVLLNAPQGRSLVNPYNAAAEKDFNMWFYLITVFYMFYGTLGWQGSQGYMSSAKSPHEMKMAGVVGQWKVNIQNIMMILLPITIYVVMHHMDFMDKAAVINQQLNEISTDPGDAVRRQMLVPVGLATILPIGLKGMFSTMVFAAFISTHDSYMHSWGAIFIQDVVMPFRKKAFSKGQHMKVLRWSIIGVAVFAFIVSVIFHHQQYIMMFMASVGAMFLGGIGAVTIGGLYWKRGSTLAAFCAMTNSLILAGGGTIVNQIKPGLLPHGQYIFAITMISSPILYVIVSLLTRTSHDMDKLLNRDKEDSEKDNDDLQLRRSRNMFRWAWNKLITHEFTKRDKIIYAVTLSWGLMWCIVFAVLTIYEKIFGAGEQFWLTFWRCWLWTLLVAAAVITTWFAIGGFKNLFELYQSLASKSVDISDDGWVERSEEHESEDRQKND